MQIFATDINDLALDRARQGTYSCSIAVDVAPERLTRFFTRLSDSEYQVTKQLRECVTFARQNVITDAPFSKLDVAICRNLLIYMEPEVQKRVIELLHFSLNEGGILFLGPSETIGRHADLFAPLSQKWRIYRRIGAGRSGNLQFAASPLEVRTAKLPSSEWSAPPKRLAEFVQTHLLRRFAAACVVINRNFEVLHYAGPHDRFLSQPAGAPTQDLLSLARPGLDSKLRVMIQRTIRDNSLQRVENVPVRHADKAFAVDIEVEPLQIAASNEGLLVVIFHERKEAEADASKEITAKAKDQAVDVDMVRQIEQELETTREDLQSTIEEMESSNEELKASNEEVMSMNEELQSTNEELETSKEELQSLNEELGTVNSQLHDKVEELEILNNDMANLLSCSEIATVFLDRDFRIKRFTPSAKSLFKLIATDIGRPLNDIACQFDDVGLLDDAALVLRDLVAREREIKSDDGRWFVRRIVPYRTLDDRIEGVVITLVDITERKHAADAVVRHLAAIVSNSADAIISKDLAGTIRTWNEGAAALFGFTAEEAVGKSIRIIVPDDRAAEWADAMVRAGQGESVHVLETERIRKDGERLTVSVTYSPLRDSGGNINGVAVIARDVSRWKQAEALLRASQERLAVEVGRLSRLHDVSTQFVKQEDPSLLLPDILDAAISITGADMGNIQLLEGGRLRIVVSRGLEKPFLSYFNAVHEGQAACGTVLRSGEVVAVEDIAKSPIFVGTPELDILLAAGIRAVQSTPLVSRNGSILGVISTHFRKPTLLTKGDLSYVDMLSRLAADWIEKVERARQIKENQAVIQAIHDSTVDAIISIDLRGSIVSVNRATEKMFGYAAADMVGQNVKMLMPSPYREAHDEYLARYLRTGEKRVIGGSREVAGRRKDGSVFPADLAVSEVDHLGFYTGVVRDITDRKRLEREIVEIASLQQRQIGQDLHDTVAQELTALGMLAGDLVETIKSGRDDAATLAGKIAEGLRRSRHELRIVLQGLLPVMIDSRGLMASLADLADRISSQGKVRCTFACSQPILVGDNLVATHLFLIAQEAVHNALKHGDATEVRIQLDPTDSGLTLAVQDNGRGMSREPASSEGLGLRIMRNRAQIIGAALDLTPALPRGTTVSCHLRIKLHENNEIHEGKAEAGPHPDH